MCMLTVGDSEHNVGDALSEVAEGMTREKCQQVNKSTEFNVVT